MVCLLFIADLEYRDQDANPITISFLKTPYADDRWSPPPPLKQMRDKNISVIFCMLLTPRPDIEEFDPGKMRWYPT